MMTLIFSLLSLVVLSILFYTIRSSKFNENTRYYTLLILAALMPAVFFTFIYSIWQYNIFLWISSFFGLIMALCYLMVANK
ncbi:hypothetical protein J4403_02795 [Candidatus Woesearchaeota archaeon]|nr:hypothetical protein [Candidatus Woesearchaeota archaeon]